MSISIDFDKVNIKDGKLVIDIDPSQQSFFETLLNAKNGVKLSDLKPKDEFKIGDEVFIVLEQTENGTRVISKEFAYLNVEFGDNSDWKVSHIRKTLNNEYLNKIAKNVGEENIIAMDRDLVSLDGLDDYGVCTDKISIMTLDEYAKYHKILGLKSDYPRGWWLITPASTPSNGSIRLICAVDVCGIIHWNSCGSTYAVRPICLLNSSTLINL